MKAILTLVFWVAVFALLAYLMGLWMHDSWNEGSHEFGLWVSATATGWLLWKAWQDARKDDDE